MTSRTLAATLATPAPLIAPSVPAAAPAVEIVVPVYNEQAILATSVRRLHDFLSTEFPFTWRIVIADNASTDTTAAIGRALAADLPGVSFLHLPVKGRGLALRTAWQASNASVVCYMDVDLSTDLRGLLPLVAPLMSGHSDLSIGTRLSHSARVVRGPRRELISRGYNRLLRLALQTRFSDAQCGFKAGRTDVIQSLLPQVADNAWFFDTELLVQAQRHAMRIHEVPVDWEDDPDSRVHIASTAWLDLKGTARLLAGSRVARFAAVGVASTAAYALLYLLLRGPLGAAGANALALAVTAVANTATNRRFTFRIQGSESRVRHHFMGFGVYVLTVALTTGALGVLHGVAPGASRGVELAVLIAASTAATITRYMALRSWVFRARRPRRLDPVSMVRVGM